MLDGGRAELQADFQQYYGLDLASLMGAFDYRRIRTLAEQLPKGSRTIARLEPRAAWSDEAYLLALVADNLSFLRYEQSGGKGRKPKPVERPRAKPRRRGKTLHVSENRINELLFARRTNRG